MTATAWWRRGEVHTALVCGAWFAAFAPGTWPKVLGGVAFAVALLPVVRRPLAAGAAVLVLDVVGILLGADPENAANLAPSVAVAYAAGRYATRFGLAVPVGLVGYATFASGMFAPANLVFGIPLFGVPYCFGRLVARRTAGAQAAAQLLASQAAADPHARARAVVARERQRLAVEAVALVRQAVDRMVELAQAGRGDRAAMAEVQEAGRGAVTELRRLLGLLRADGDDTRSAQPSPRPRRPSWLADTAVAVALAGLVVAEAATWSGPAGPASVALAVAISVTVGLRRREPWAACLLAAAGLAGALLAGIPLMIGVWLVILAGLLAWSAGAAGTLVGWLALATTVATLLAVLRRDDPDNAGIYLVMIGLVAVSAHLWSERNRAEHAALAGADRLRERSEAVVHAAVHEERRRLARELHDVASHAVAVMVLQAGAAGAQWDRDRAAAERALDQIRLTGTATLAELDTLHRLLATGAEPGADADGPLADLYAQMRRIRAAGADLRVSIDGAVVDRLDPGTARVVERVTREALTNALRHAPGSRVVLSVQAHGRDAVAVEVRDAGGDRPTAPHESGFGLVGLAERVRGLGGDLSAGPHDDGFAVRAVLPLPAVVGSSTIRAQPVVGGPEEVA